MVHHLDTATHEEVLKENMLIGEWKEWLWMNDENIVNIWYADDTPILTNTGGHLQKVMNRLVGIWDNMVSK